MKNVQALINGKWVYAKEIPYYPSFIEKLLHIFGVHQWTYTKPRKCVMCSKKES